MLNRTIVGRTKLNVIALSGSAAIIGKYKVSERLTLCSGLSTVAAPVPSTLAPKITLYEYKICPFCNKVKAYLDYLEVDYESVEVNPLTKSELTFQKEFKKVPVVILNGLTSGESAEIILKITDTINSGTYAIVKPPSTFYPEDTQEWSDWADKKLAVMLYPNITRTMSESWECFSYIDDQKQWNMPLRAVTKSLGSLAMSFANGKIKKKYGIVDERAELKTCLLVWTKAVAGKSFLHGEDITMPDILVFGVLRAIEGTTTFTFMMEENLELNAWYDRVKRRIPRKK
jgi:microsomal prostaglandin-E synthase 2